MRFLKKARGPDDENLDTEKEESLDEERERRIEGGALAHFEEDIHEAEAEGGWVSERIWRRKKRAAEEEEGEVQPRRGRVIAVTNQKGGVGKSTTAVNLGTYAALEGKRVLLIDLDPQGNASSGLGIERRQITRCIYSALAEDTELKEIALQTEVEGLWVVPSTINLAGAEIELVSAMSRENRLKNVIAPIAEEFDYIFIDCPPSLGLLTINALTAAEEVLIPIQCEFYALEGLVLLMRTIQQVKAHLNPDLEINGILMTMFDARTNLSKQVVQEVAKLYPDKLYRAIIPRSIRLSEAPSYGQPIALYDGTSKGALAYQELAKEVIENG